MLCTACRNRPAQADRRWCEHCTQRRRRRAERQRAARPIPLCRRCGTAPATECSRNLCLPCFEQRQEERAAKEAKRTGRLSLVAFPEARRPSRPDDAEEGQGKALDGAALRELRVIDPATVADSRTARQVLNRLCDLPESPALDADIRLLSRLVAAAEEGMEAAEEVAA